MEGEENERHRRIQMFINEAGKLEHLPINEIATTVFRSYFDTNDWIAGDALICGCDQEGACDLTDEQIQNIRNRANL